MSEYRAYAIGPDGHIFKAEPMICENDDEAIARVRALAAEHTIEIWSGDRFVVRLDPAHYTLGLTRFLSANRCPLRWKAL
jgi:hypothetical protein